MTARAQPPGPDSSAAANLLAMRRDPLGFFAGLARDHGDFVRFTLGAQDMFLVNHPELIKDLLVTHDRAFEKWFAVGRTRELLGNGLFVSEGAYHQRQRKLAQPAFHRERIARYAAIMVQCTREIGARWRDGATVDVAAEMNRLTMNIVAQTLFGAEVDAEAGEIGAALSAILALFERATLPPDEVAEFEQMRARLDATILRMIAQRRASAGEDRGDLLSMLLLAQDEDDGTGMSDAQIRDEAMTIFLAGHETTANALTWTWYLLSQNPGAAAAMRAELGAVFGNGEPHLAGLAELKTCRGIFSEALRLYPPVWAMGRRALQELELGGFPIAKGSVVIASQYLAQRDPRWFPQPEVFDPSRWNEETAAARPRFSFFPFSAGSRGCLGENFAWMESLFALAILSPRWELQLAPEQRIALQPQLTLRPKYGMRMLALERNHPKLSS